MNSRLLLLFLIIASFIVIWSDDQKKTDTYLASLEQEKVTAEFTLNCFPEYNYLTQQLQTLDQWTFEFTNLDPSNIQSIDITIKDCFPSSLTTASLCPVEENISEKQIDAETRKATENSEKPMSYLRTASKILNWMKTQSAEMNSKNHDQLLLKLETPLMDRIADEIIESINESFQQIQIMTETYQQAMEKTEKSSRIASEPKSDTIIQ
jgi:hypothetical protein